MKGLLAVLFAGVASVTFSAQLQWGAFYLPIPQGMTYIVQASQQVSVDQITGALKNGIPASAPQGYAVLDKQEIITKQSISYVKGTEHLMVDMSSGENMFIVVVDTSKTAFAVSDIVKASSGDQQTYSLNYNLDNSQRWTSGQVVPEPTALALLALGVAGLALKRRAA